MVINRKARYPFTSVGTWTTRVWLLFRHSPRPEEASSIDRRVAAILLNRTPAGYPQALWNMLFRWIGEYDAAHESFCEALDRFKAEAQLDSDSRDHDPGHDRHRV